MILKPNVRIVLNQPERNFIRKRNTLRQIISESIQYLIIPENFSRTDLLPTHMMSTEAILAMTLVTYGIQEKEKKKIQIRNRNKTY